MALQSGKFGLVTAIAKRQPPWPRGRPSSAGTWPIMIVSARPTMKPLRTGAEMNDAMNPSRSSPATSARTPVTIAKVAVSATYRSLPAAA